VSLDRKRWALLAQDLKFSQLDIARKQADAWRIGLGALTGLLTAVLVLTGRNNVSDLTGPAQGGVVALLALALAALITATLLVSRSLSGPAGRRILLNGEDLEEWTKAEVRKISWALRLAPPLAAAGVVAVALAVGITWLAPVRSAGAGLVQVTQTAGQRSCGQLGGASDHQLVITPAGGPAQLIPLSSVAVMTPVTACP
jgi:hypothetical protein